MAKKIFIVVVNEIRIHKIRRAIVAEDEREAISLAVMPEAFITEEEKDGIRDLGDGQTDRTVVAELLSMEARNADRELTKMELSQDWDAESVHAFFDRLDAK